MGAGSFAWGPLGGTRQPHTAEFSLAVQNRVGGKDLTKAGGKTAHAISTSRITKLALRPPAARLRTILWMTAFRTICATHSRPSAKAPGVSTTVPRMVLGMSLQSRHKALFCEVPLRDLSQQGARRAQDVSGT